MNTLPRKFYRMLTDAILGIVRFCAGRKRSYPSLHSSKISEPMNEPISQLFLKLDSAVTFRDYWKEERRRLGTLQAPRTDWKLTAHSNEVIILSHKIAERIDELIPTHKLYVDLLESAE